MNATISRQVLPSTSAPMVEGEVGKVSGAPRALLRGEGAVVLMGATLAYSALGDRCSVFALLFLVPDLSMLGYLAGRRVGATSYGLKYGTGFGHTHLGDVGRSSRSAS